MKHRKGQNMMGVALAVSVAVTSSVIGTGIMLSEAQGASPSTEHMALCAVEDSGPTDPWGQPVYPCMWDAEHMGNGMGSSYILYRSEKVNRVTHARAHRVWLANGKVQ